MAKKQTRRAIALKADTYDQVTIFSQSCGISRSAFIEELVTAFFDAREPTFAPPANEADEADEADEAEAPPKKRRGFPDKTPVPKAKEEPPRGGGVHSL